MLDSFAQSLTVTPTPSTSVPTFSWSAPSSPPTSYGYNIQVSGGSTWWYYPQDGLIPSAQSSVTYDVDGSASTSSLNSGVQYQWQITVVDSNGNQATRQATYSF